MVKIRLRFAPSPTGFLHIGGARTALFNWLAAKKYNGKFLLRIEDTDQLRSKKEFEKQIIADLRWLGLNWNEEIIYQSNQLSVYRKIAFQLLEEGKAYRCFCSKEKLDALRKESKNFKYPRICRNLTKEEIEEKIANSLPFAIRVKIPETIEGKNFVEWNDIVRGNIKVELTQLDDFIILRSDGLPTYNFAVVIDDNKMEITHVLRGEDHITNTAKQIVLYNLLSYKIPIFGHLPLILGEDKKRLSKRHGATAISEYRNLGFIPQAIINYLALLGAGFDEKEQIFTIDELIDRFEFSRIKPSASIFDIQKMIWINQQHLKKLSSREKVELIKPFLIENNLLIKDDNYLLKIIDILEDRLKLLTDFINYADFFLLSSTEIAKKYNLEEKKIRKNIKKVLQFKNIIPTFINHLSNLDKWNRNYLEEKIKNFVNENNIKLSPLIFFLRYAISAKTVTPGIYESLEILGKNNSIERINQFYKIIKDYEMDN